MEIIHENCEFAVENPGRKRRECLIFLMGQPKCLILSHPQKFARKVRSRPGHPVRAFEIYLRFTAVGGLPAHIR